MDASVPQLLLTAAALAAALLVRPWRMLRSPDGMGGLATPLVAAAVLLPALWSLPVLGGLPVAAHWSGAPLAVLVLGWPLAIPVFVLAGFSTLLSPDQALAHAVTLVFWSGVVPATATLVLGHGVRVLAGAHPQAYLLGRGFLVPMLAIGGAALLAPLGLAASPVSDDLRVVASFLLAMGESAWTCAVASLLLAFRPEWLATWPRPRAVRVTGN